MNRHDVVRAIKNVVYPWGESYRFAGRNLRFKTGCRPVRRKYINASDDVVRNDVLQINYFEQHLRADDVIWDIGSHSGHYSIFAAAIAAGPNQVYSFEPDIVAREIQLQNIRMNKMEDKIKLFNFAVSGQDGESLFEMLDGNANSHLIGADGIDSKKLVTVPTKTIDTLSAELPRPRVVKIDTEGAEIDILSAAGSLLSDSTVKFVCELHPFAWNSFNVQYRKLTEILESHNRVIELLDKTKMLHQLPYYGTILF